MNTMSTDEGTKGKSERVIVQECCGSAGRELLDSVTPIIAKHTDDTPHLDGE